MELTERAKALMKQAEMLARGFPHNEILTSNRPSEALLTNIPPKKARPLTQLRYDRFLDPNCRLNRIEQMLLDNYDKRKPIWEIP